MTSVRAVGSSAMAPLMSPPNLMPSGSGSLGGAGPLNMPYGGGRGRGRGPDSKPPSKMMRMDDTGLLFTMLMMLIIIIIIYAFLYRQVVTSL